MNESFVSGTRKMYSLIRRDLALPFYHAQLTPDVLLKKIHHAITSRQVCDVITQAFPDVTVPEAQETDDVMEMEERAQG